MRSTLPFALPIGLSAFLLFSVEPLVGRLVLPVFGGAAAVWAHGPWGGCQTWLVGVPVVLAGLWVLGAWQRSRKGAYWVTRNERERRGF